MSEYVDRFASAVETLVGEGPVKLRLTKAYSDHLEALRDVDLPVQLNGALGELHAALHSVKPVGKQSRVDASVQKMSQDEAGRFAATIVKVYAELVRHASRPEPLKVVEGRDVRHDLGQEPPRFLVTGS